MRFVQGFPGPRLLQLLSSAGYMVNRAIGNAESLAAAIQASLDNGLSLNDVSQKAWNAVWPQEALRIRDFQVFGMEVLLNMNLDQSRAFFKCAPISQPSSYARPGTRDHSRAYSGYHAFACFAPCICASPKGQSLVSQFPFLACHLRSAHTQIGGSRLAALCGIGSPFWQKVCWRLSFHVPGSMYS